MLSTARRIARSLSVLVLALFLVPGALARCGEVSAFAGDLMGCCKPGSHDTGLKAECCVVEEAQPGSERPASTTPSPRSSSHALAAILPELPLGLPAISGDASPVTAAAASPPDRLYLKYGVIRR